MRTSCYLPLFLLVASVCAAAANTELSADDILSRQLATVGSPDAVKAQKSRVVEGRAVYRILVGGSGHVDGKAVLVSEPGKMQLLLKINAQRYHGERFVTNGSKTNVEGTYDDHTRSELGQFLWAEDDPLREQLLGGVLSIASPLLNHDAWSGRFHADGMKKVDGEDLYEVSYKPKKNPDLEITFFFDPNTFHHVRTLYKASVHAGIVSGNPDVANTIPGAPLSSGPEAGSARQQQTRYRIEERFADFKTADGLTLPSHYELRFTEELQSGFTKTVVWEVNTTRVLNNVDLDARNFEVH